MDPDIGVSEIRKELSMVKHPAIDCDLVKLGIIKEITLDDKQAVITMAYPFPSIPIKDYLENSVKKALGKMKIAAEIKSTVMDQNELQAFLALEKEHWKGL